MHVYSSSSRVINDNIIFNPSLLGGRTRIKSRSSSSSTTTSRCARFIVTWYRYSSAVYVPSRFFPRRRHNLSSPGAPWGTLNRTKHAKQALQGINSQYISLNTVEI